MSVTDISGDGFGMVWGHTRVYCNQLEINGSKTNVNYGNGFNWLTKTTAYLVDLNGDDTAIQVTISPRQSYWFNLISGSYVGAFGALQKLAHDAANGIFRFIQTDGSVWQFFDFDQSANPLGAVSSVVSAGGESSLTFTYPNAVGPVSDVERSYTSGGITTIESFTYAYLPSPDLNAGLISSVRLRRKIGSGSWIPIERVEFSYYEPTSTFGGSNDLQTAVHQLPNGSGGWDSIKTYYYRYYRDAEGGIGFSHGLKFALQPEAFVLLSAAVADPLAATDEELAQFADFYFEYDVKQRVVLERVEAGTLEYRFVYTTSSNSIDYNHWQVKTVEILPDGSQNVVYTNHIGQVLLTDFSKGSNHWITYNKYDELLGKMILQAMPSAVQGYDDSLEDLGGPTIIVKESSGLVNRTSYYATTTASATTAGGVKGYQHRQSIQHGRTGSLIKLSESAYFRRNSTDDNPSVPLVTIYPTASNTVFPSDTNQSLTEITTYAYTFFTGTCAIKQKTTTFPVVSTAQNGTDVAAEQEEVFDIFGYLNWRMDERGFIFCNRYDVVKGTVEQRIEDVDTFIVTDGPSGWTTPTGGGLNLVSDFEYDDRGRITQTLGPLHSIDISSTATTVRRATWNVYQDETFQRWTGQGYATGSPGSYSYTLINPVSITKFKANNLVSEQVQATRASTSGKLLPTDTFAQSSYVRWTTNQYTDCCLLSSTRIYHLIPSSGTGSSVTNYDQTTFGYDSMKRRNRVVVPSGTITRTVYDVRGQSTKAYVGTDDNGATPNDPTGGGASGNNMVQVTGMVYDDGATGGNGNMTKQTNHVNATTNRVTKFLYDFRDRRVATDGEVDFYQESIYDNLNRIVRRDRKDTTATGPLVAQSETRFDARGRNYQTLRYAVDPNTGTVGNALTDNIWYDATGNTLCLLPSGSEAFSKSLYDGIGRVTASYSGYLSSGTFNPDSVANDVIFDQNEMQYDAASNIVFTTARQRWDNATGTGSLNGPSGSQPKSRDSYSANWSDALGRMIATANYGTNSNAGPPTRPGAVPASSDTVLVNETRYNSAGEGFETVDASGKIDRMLFDAAGRTTKTIQNVQSGGGTPGNEENVTVEQSYAGGHLVTLTAKNPETGDQVTTYTYGTLSNSDVASNDLLRSETYPDSVDSSDKVTYTHNRQGQPNSKTDQNGSVHSFSYDKLARQTADSITTLGSGVNGSVRRIGQTYEVRGMVENNTSFSDAAGTTPVNQVRHAYNDFGQLVIQYQAHSGIVNTSTSPKVEYDYEDGSANTIRPTTMTYPDGKVLTYQYDNTDAAKLSRVRTLDWDGTDVCRYGYLGGSTFVITDYLEPEVKIDYALGSGANRYDGFDRFGRVINLPWTNYGTPTDLVHLKYGYDRISNRIWRVDIVAQANSHNFDELYGYDGMQRLEDFERGLLNGGHNAITSPTFEQDWELDATGNWKNFAQTVPPDSSQDIVQERLNNAVNELTDIDNTTGATWITPEYDRNGNSTLFPVPSDPTDSYTSTWDAWNRLVAIHDSSSALVASYAYDGQNWRITKTDSSVTRHYYYSSGWQALEERLDTSTDPERQFVWGIRYVDDLVLRERDTDNNGTLDERLYALQDANWNVTAIANTSGVVQERYNYQAYGTCTVLDPSFTSSTSSFEWETLYGSYRFDPESSLYHIRHRYFNSALGNWISRDPIGYEGGLNPFRYVKNQPTTLLDPSGNLDIPFPCFTVGDTFVEGIPKGCWKICWISCWLALPCRGTRTKFNTWVCTPTTYGLLYLKTATFYSDCV
ncbi:MAG: RHS repeat-associated core domain-containing protein [Pirellulaceae bacterium]|nr:RHS repeat-associated core domain-containing protein [Pirellulaceae bacterium]